MPNTASATKALRQSKRKKLVNDRIKKSYKGAIKTMRETPSAEALSAVASALDKAAKKHVILQSKADRLKSRLSSLLTASK